VPLIFSSFFYENLTQLFHHSASTTLILWPPY